MATQHESREYLLGRNVSLDTGLSALIRHLDKTEKNTDLLADYNIAEFIGNKLGEILNMQLSRLKESNPKLAANPDFQAGFNSGKEKLTNLLPSRPIG